MVTRPFLITDYADKRNSLNLHPARGLCQCLLHPEMAIGVNRSGRTELQRYPVIHLTQSCCHVSSHEQPPGYTGIHRHSQSPKFDRYIGDIVDWARRLEAG